MGRISAFLAGGITAFAGQMWLKLQYESHMVEQMKNSHRAMMFYKEFDVSQKKFDRLVSQEMTSDSTFHKFKVDVSQNIRRKWNMYLRSAFSSIKRMLGSEPKEVS